MTYTPAINVFATAFLLRKMLSESDTVQEILGAADATEALAKITTYSDDDLEFPRVFVCEQDVFLHADELELSTQTRSLTVHFEFYAPNDDESITTTSDEHTWVLEKLAAILQELLELRGTGEPITGVTHLHLYDPVLHQPDKIGHDERPSYESAENRQKALWMGGLSFSVGAQE